MSCILSGYTTIIHKLNAQKVKNYYMWKDKKFTEFHCIMLTAFPVKGRGVKLLCTRSRLQCRG